MQSLIWFADKTGGKLIYISTDYVFDGKTPPYKCDSATNPLNDYGQSKLDGENVVIEESKGTF